MNSAADLRARAAAVLHAASRCAHLQAQAQAQEQAGHAVTSMLLRSTVDGFMGAAGQPSYLRAQGQHACHQPVHQSPGGGMQINQPWNMPWLSAMVEVRADEWTVEATCRGMCQQAPHTYAAACTAPSGRGDWAES